jgi:phosphoglycolate phosphatase-like HAD superfamily hydrolase
MRKILILMSFVLPVALMAQTRPAPKKAIDRKPATKDNIRQEKPTVHSYMIMEVVEVKSKKEPTVLQFKFESLDRRISDKYQNSFKNVKTVIDALNKLGQRGWELVSVENRRYFLKNKFVAKRP